MAEMRARYASIRAALPATMGEVCEKLGMGKQRASKAFVALRGRDMVHICDWRPATAKGAKPSPVYASGRGKTAPRGAGYVRRAQPEEVRS